MKKQEQKATKTAKTRAFVNYGMETNAASGNIAKNLQKCMKNALLRASCKTAFNVVKTCRQHSGGKQWETLTEIMREIALFSRNGQTINGDGLQLVWNVYETITNCIEIDVISGNLTDSIINILYPFTSASDEMHDEMMRTYMTEKQAKPYISERVVIKKADSAKISIIDIAPRQIAARKVREYVNMHCAPDTRGQKAVYIDGMTETELNNLTWNGRIYYKIDDAQNEQITIDTVHENAKMHEIIDEMQLTDTQKDVLSLKIRGYGLQAIGTYRGKSKQAVAKTLQQIAEKARKCGLLNVTKYDENEMKMMQAIDTMFTGDNNEKQAKTYISPQIEIIPLEKALEIYTKTAKTRAKRAKTIARYLKNKNKIAEKRYAQNARICAENEEKCAMYHEYLQIEYDAKILAMYYSK